MPALLVRPGPWSDPDASKPLHGPRRRPLATAGEALPTPAGADRTRAPRRASPALPRPADGRRAAGAPACRTRSPRHLTLGCAGDRWRISATVNPASRDTLAATWLSLAMARQRLLRSALPQCERLLRSAPQCIDGASRSKSQASGLHPAGYWERGTQCIGEATTVSWFIVATFQ